MDQFINAVLHLLFLRAVSVGHVLTFGLIAGDREKLRGYHECSYQNLKAVSLWLSKCQDALNKTVGLTEAPTGRLLMDRYDLKVRVT